MNTNTETYKVLINGDEFHLVSDEAETHVRQAVEKVNAVIKALTAGASHLDKRKVAVLAAVQLASELQQLQNDVAEIRRHESHLVSLVDRALTSL